MAASSNGPVPSKHVFIHQLPQQDSNAKVRFLGCVIDYNGSSGKLMIEHNYPRGTSSLSTKVMVDINILLETTKTESLQPGSWINVIGYVQDILPPKNRRSSSRYSRLVEDLPKVQAVLLWSAGTVRVEEYERTLEAHLSTNPAL